MLIKRFEEILRPRAEAIQELFWQKIDEAQESTFAPIRRAAETAKIIATNSLYAGIACSALTILLFCISVTLVILGVVTYFGFYMYLIPIQAHHVPLVFDYSAKLSDIDDAHLSHAWESLQNFGVPPTAHTKPQFNFGSNFNNQHLSWAHSVPETSGPIAWATLDAAGILRGSSGLPSDPSYASRRRVPSYGYSSHTTTSGGASSVLSSRGSAPRDVDGVGTRVASKHSHLFGHSTPNPMKQVLSGSTATGVYSSNRYLPSLFGWLEGWLPWWIDIFASGSSQSEAAPYWAYSETSPISSQLFPDAVAGGNSIVDQIVDPSLFHDLESAKIDHGSSSGSNEGAQSRVDFDFESMLSRFTPDLKPPASILKPGTSYDVFLEMQLPEDPPLSAPMQNSRLPWKGTILTLRMEAFAFDHLLAAHDIGMQRLNHFSNHRGVRIVGNRDYITSMGTETQTQGSAMDIEKIIATAASAAASVASKLPGASVQSAATAAAVAAATAAATISSSSRANQENNKQFNSQKALPRWISQLAPLTRHPFQVHSNWRPIATARRSFAPFAASSASETGIYGVPFFGPMLRLVSRIFPFSLFFAPNLQPAATWPGPAEVNSGTIPGSTGFIAGIVQWFFSVIRSAFLFWPRVFGFVSSTQTHTMLLMQDFVERVELPTTGIRMTLIGPEAFETPILSGRLSFVSRLDGIRYYMYHHFWTFAVLGSLFFSFIHMMLLSGIATCLVCTFMVARSSSQTLEYPRNEYNANSRVTSRGSRLLMFDEDDDDNRVVREDVVEGNEEEESGTAEWNEGVRREISGIDQGKSGPYTVAAAAAAAAGSILSPNTSLPNALHRTRRKNRKMNQNMKESRERNDGKVSSSDFKTNIEKLDVELDTIGMQEESGIYIQNRENSPAAVSSSMTEQYETVPSATPQENGANSRRASFRTQDHFTRGNELVNTTDNVDASRITRSLFGFGVDRERDLSDDNSTGDGIEVQIEDSDYNDENISKIEGEGSLRNRHRDIVNYERSAAVNDGTANADPNSSSALHALLRESQGVSFQEESETE